MVLALVLENVKFSVEFHSIVMLRAASFLVIVKPAFFKTVSRLVRYDVLVTLRVIVLIDAPFLFSKVKVFCFFNCI